MHRISRRTLLTAGAAALLGGQTRAALAQRGLRPGAGEMLQCAHIGTGRYGRVLLAAQAEDFNAQAAILCDVDRRQLRAAAAYVGPETEVRLDYRTALAPANIDAAVIATPDHGHAVQAVFAIEAGKDAWLASPVCNGPAEARALLGTAADYEAVLHAGLPLFERAVVAEALATGTPNAPVQAEAWAPENAAGGDPLAASGPPPELDWDRWLGPHRWVPHYDARPNGDWRWMLSLGGGRVREAGTQALAVALAVAGQTGTTRFRVSAEGEAPDPAARFDVPARLRATVEADGFTFRWSQPGPAEAGASGLRIQADGETRLALDTLDDSAAEVAAALDAWHSACRTRADRTRHLAVAAQAAALTATINAAWYAGQPLDLDLTAATPTGHAAADARLQPLARGPWRL